MDYADDDLTLPISKDIDNEDTNEAVSEREEEMVATTSQVKHSYKNCAQIPNHVIQ